MSTSSPVLKYPSDNISLISSSEFTDLPLTLYIISLSKIPADSAADFFSTSYTIRPLLTLIKTKLSA